MAELNTGKLTQIIGAVLDVRFSEGKLPEINDELLDVYNYQLIITGSNIILLRQKFIQELKSHAIMKHSNIAEFENFDIEYSVKETKIEDIAKHLEEEKASFSFERIEPNQKTSMSYAQNFAHITNMGFVIYWERTPEKLYFLPYDRVLRSEQEGKKSVKIEDLDEFKAVLKYASDNIE